MAKRLRASSATMSIALSCGWRRPSKKWTWRPIYSNIEIMYLQIGGLRFMFVRTAICLTFIFFAGAAFAEWQSLPRTGSQAVSRVIQASLTQGANSMETAGARHASRPEVEALIRQGNKRMREGDILGARRSYQEAFASGDAAAALVMARSFDPIYFARIAERNAEPEPAKAFEWYGHASDAGAVQTAMVRIEDLKRFMSR